MIEKITKTKQSTLCVHPREAQGSPPGPHRAGTQADRQTDRQTDRRGHQKAAGGGHRPTAAGPGVGSRDGEAGDGLRNSEWEGLQVKVKRPPEGVRVARLPRVPTAGSPAPPGAYSVVLHIFGLSYHVL